MQPGYRILLIEDNEASAKFYATHLEAKGYFVQVAGNGMAGLELARQNNLDLILLDLMLPQIDGFKICRMIKYDKALKNIPVAILTSRDTEEEAETAKSCGADAFLLKSTHIDIVLEVIEKLIKEPPRSVKS